MSFLAFLVAFVTLLICYIATQSSFRHALVTSARPGSAKYTVAVLVLADSRKAKYSFLKPHLLAVAALVRTSMEHRIDVDLFVDTGAHLSYAAKSKTERIAFHRNRMIATLNLDIYTHVLWVDSDICSIPPNLLVRMLAENPRGISSPVVLSESGSTAHMDRCAFMPRVHAAVTDCTNVRFSRTLVDKSQMNATAFVVLVPSAVYLAGARHEPHQLFNEYNSVFASALASGIEVLLFSSIIVVHGDSSKYGLYDEQEPPDVAPLDSIQHILIFVPAQIGHEKTLLRTLFNVYQIGSQSEINHNAFLYFRRHSWNEARQFDRTPAINTSPFWGLVVWKMWVKMSYIRNRMVDHVSLNRVDYAWWLDFDIVVFPMDLGKLAVANGNKAITCPTVLIEGTYQFYDTCGFVPAGQSDVSEHVRRTWNGCDCTMLSADGPPSCMVDENPTILPGDGIHINNLPASHEYAYVNVPEERVEMDGCGAVYIMPAALLRSGVRYAYDPMFTDHFPMMKLARQRGYKIWWHRSSIAYHADVDNFGPLVTDEKRTANV